MATPSTAPAPAPKTARTGQTTIWLDGEWHTRDTATVSVFDHGLLYGDGVFEGIRAYGGKIFRLEEHLDRLYDSAQAIWLTVPMSKAEMIAITEEAVRRSGITEAYIRHIITRGKGDLGLSPKNCPRATIIIIVDTISLWPAATYETGLRVITAGTPIPHREALSPRVKSLNYLPHIMAKSEGIVAGMDDVLMLDSTGFVAEASGCNIFVVKGTHDPDAARLCRDPQGRHPRPGHRARARGRLPDDRGTAQSVRHLHRRRGLLHRHGRRGDRAPRSGRPPYRCRQAGPRHPRHRRPLPGPDPRLTSPA